jgi:Transmembrane domain of unknown function (DUF3566)
VTGSGDSRTMGSGPLFGDAAKAAMARGGSSVVPGTSRDESDSPSQGDKTAVTKPPSVPSAPAAPAKPAGKGSSTSNGRSGSLGSSNGFPPVPAAPPAAQRRPMTVGTAPVARRKGRRARLTVKRIDPWTTLKFSFVYGLAGMVVLLVTVVVLYGVVDAMGVINSIRTFIGDVSSSSNSNGTGLIAWLSFGRVMLVAVVIGAINVVLFTAFATLTAFIYNVCTDIVGGVEVTLAERS